MSVGLTLLQSPQSFVVREECRKAAWQNGYRRPLEQHDGWWAFGSTTAKGPDYPSETFRVLKYKEIRQHGEYRTRRLVLEAWDRMEADGTFRSLDL